MFSTSWCNPSKQSPGRMVRQWSSRFEFDSADKILVGPIALPRISAAKTGATRNLQPGSGRHARDTVPLGARLQAVHADS
jgi:hypothetical protein